MREILFRGKRKDNGEWICGEYITIYDDPKYKAIKTCIELNTGIYEVVPDTVCQCTGLTDKNGRKIFEGDICEFTIYCFDGGYEHYIGVIVFVDGCYMICESPKGEEFKNNEMFYLTFAVENGVDFIVTGNIADRPDFIGGRVF